jgi:peptidoglycan/xylan/chitin deacetylase (PgdA/CDA1 family)
LKRGSVFSNKSAGKMVALTFDDGPFAAKTPKILQILQENNARATFFMLGRYVKNHPELPQQVLEAGSEVGSHSWFHSKQTALTAEERANDFALTAKAFEDAIGYAPYVFRAPYGAVDADVKQDVSDQNMIMVLWSLDTEDWKAKSAEQVYNSVMNVVKDGDIILMHENGEYTLEALPRILAALSEQGYEVVTVSELVYAGSDAQAAAGN